MKIVPALFRHRRLEVLLLVSLCLHAAVIGLAGAPAAVGSAAATADQLSVRLLPLRPERPPAPSTAHPSPAPAPARTATRPRAGHAPIQRAATAAPATQSKPETIADAPMRMPGRYRVRMPPSAQLAYRVTYSRPDTPATHGEARIDWQTDGNSYRLRMDGVLGILGSEGGSSDTGIAPRSASEELPGGARLSTTFDEASSRIAFGAGGTSAPIRAGAQDRASVLMQLAGMGLAEPDQIKDIIEIVVAGSDAAQIARFQVLGQEQLATGAGACSAWHLVQLAAPGAPRIELWLAPEHGWLAVQLRVTGPGGAVATQVLDRIETPDQLAAR